MLLTEEEGRVESRMTLSVQLSWTEWLMIPLTKSVNTEDPAWKERRDDEIHLSMLSLKDQWDIQKVKQTVE